jgi:hypothetical protein
MSNGDLEKKMEFIIEQQAQFTVDIQVLREVQAIQAADSKLLKDAVMTIVGLIGKLAEAQERTQARVTEFQAHAETRFAALAEAQTHTNATVAEVAERLNIFINVVERYISGNGNKGSGDRA